MSGPVTPEIVEASDHTRALLTLLGVPVTAHTMDTPERWARSLMEMTNGLRTDPALLLERTFPPESDDPGMIVVPGVPFTSLCEHHMLPFSGMATVGYLPKASAPIVGLSKLARVVQGYAARPQVQERLGAQVVEAITAKLLCDGAGCVIRSAHTCMTNRGVRAQGATMITSHLVGRFRDDPQVRAEFLSFAGGHQ